MRKQLFSIPLSLKFHKFFPHALKTQKFCKVKPIHRNHVFGMTVFYQFQITGNDKGLICHDERWAYRETTDNTLLPRIMVHS